MRRVVEDFPSFDDVTTYADRPVRLYKRAQILAFDLYGALAPAGSPARRIWRRSS